MMEKIIPVGGWDFQMETTALIKSASGGMGVDDRRTFLLKRAAANVFADQLSKVALFPGDIPIHTIAIGATEAYGCNRNGDGFNEATCRKQASTFESKPLRDYTDKEAHNGARFFRHHKNGNPEKSYGYVKLAAYNPDMRRIELLLIGNGTKEAANRNGGFVMPDSTRELLENGEDMPGSMACKVAYDVCQNCFHKAAHRGNYCTSDTCISPHDGHRGLGCKHGLTKLSHYGRQQFVENPNSMFFDWSEVLRPADRNAYGGTADYIKAASAGHIMGGAELAEFYAQQNGAGFSFNWEPSRDKTAFQQKLAHNLAAIEGEMESPGPSDLATARAFSPLMQPSMEMTPLRTAGGLKLASGLKALADQGVLLTPEDFLKATSGLPGNKMAGYADTIARSLPGVFNRLVADPNLETLLRNNPYKVATDLPSWELRSFATKLAETRCCYPSAVQERVQLSAIRTHQTPTKLASVSLVKLSATGDPSDDLARQYALYKLAFLAEQASDELPLPLTSRMVVLHNYVI